MNQEAEQETWPQPLSWNTDFSTVQRYMVLMYDPAKEPSEAITAVPDSERYFTNRLMIPKRPEGVNLGSNIIEYLVVSESRCAVADQ